MNTVSESDTPRKTLYPEIAEPNDCGMIKVSPLHTIYWEECGNPKGEPILFLHGGPGGGLYPIYRRYFDPKYYRIILFDQRGCGKSTPHACLEDNTTWDLVNDIGTIRRLLGITRWVVFGGSWGSTLALAYAKYFPEQVKALILRGIWLGRPSEVRWLYQDGTAHTWPDAWEKFAHGIPEDEREDLVAAYYRRLTSSDEKTRWEAARYWGDWEASIAKLIPAEKGKLDEKMEATVYARARIECHYFVNNHFFEENELLRDIDEVRHTPAVIVQGRYDTLCPMSVAWELHRAWPEADFRIVPDAGHSGTEPGIIHELVSATDRFRTL